MAIFFSLYNPMDLNSDLRKIPEDELELIWEEVKVQVNSTTPLNEQVRSNF